MNKSGKRLTVSGVVLLSIGIVILITLLIITLVIGHVGLTGDGGGGSDAGTRLELEPEQQAPVTSMADTAMISIPGMESMTIPANTATVSTRLYNPEDNPCYFEISITLEDGTELYHSKLVSPGQELYEIELAQTLEAGTYSAILHYSTYSLEDGTTPMNGASVPFTLYVTN